MRSCILSNLEKIHEFPELIYFLSTLSLHCFVNEYVYAVSEEEILLVDELEDMNKQLFRVKSIETNQQGLKFVLGLYYLGPLDIVVYSKHSEESSYFRTTRFVFTLISLPSNARSLDRS